MKLVQHLKDRGMNPDLYNYSKSYSANAITFYLWNLSGQLVGYQQYRPLKIIKKQNNPKSARYFTYLPSGVDGCFGLELLDYSKKDLYIVEGVFKAAILHRLGFNAVAVLTSSPKRFKSWFKSMRQIFNIIAIGDNDAAGAKLVRIVGRGFQSPVDLDEMTDEDMLEMLDEYHTKGSNP